MQRALRDTNPNRGVPTHAIPNLTPGTSIPLDRSCLSDKHKEDKDKCLSGEVIAAWLHAWAMFSGTGFNGTRPAQGNQTWIAHPDMYSQLTKGGQYYVWEARTLPIRQADLALTDSKGTLLLTHLLIPVFIPPATGCVVGHWILAELDLQQHQTRPTDSVSHPGEMVGRHVSYQKRPVMERPRMENHSCCAKQARQHIRLWHPHALPHLYPHRRPQPGTPKTRRLPPAQYHSTNPHSRGSRGRYPT